MASGPHVLCVALGHTADDDQSSHVLVAVSPARDASQSLDLELLATDDQKAYVMTLSHARLARYKQPNTSYEDPDWEGALKAVLLPDQPIGDIETTARIADDEEKPTGDARGYMFIDIRSKVSGPTETLGTLKLRKSNKAEAAVELFDWCVESIRVRDKLERDVVELRREHDALKTLVAEETAKIRELARSKQDFEATHDSWLKDLLNEKKVKIRTQERLLATAHVDPDKLAAAAVAAAATAGKPRHRGGVGASRTGKRKAGGSNVGDDGQNSAEEEATDKMDVDDADEAPDESHDEEMGEVDKATTGSETASDPGSNPEPKQSTAGGKKGRGSPGSSASGSFGEAGKTSKAGKAGHNLRDKKIVRPDESEDEDPPRKKSPAQKKKSVPVYDPAADDESTASE